MPYKLHDPDAPSSPLGRFVDAVPGWLMIAGGLALIAMSVLTPAWLELRRTSWQLELMQQQAQAMTEQTDRYEQFLAAVESNDPVLLERLAYTQLRLQPVQRETLPLADEPVDAVSQLPPGDIDRWLRVELPVVGEDLAELTTPDSRLVRLAGTSLRFGLIAVGACCLLAGFWWGPGKPHRRHEAG